QPSPSRAAIAACIAAGMSGAGRASMSVVGAERVADPVQLGAGRVTAGLHHIEAARRIWTVLLQQVQLGGLHQLAPLPAVHRGGAAAEPVADRKSTRLNSSHVKISYAVFC